MQTEAITQVQKNIKAQQAFIALIEEKGLNGASGILTPLFVIPA